MNIALPRSSKLIKLFDGAIWCAYLLLLVMVSFVNDLYSSQEWLMVSSCVYALCGLFILSALNGGQCNWRGVVQAKYALVILGAMVALLYLQVVLPFDKHLDILLLEEPLFKASTPTWFDPAARWSVVPIKTLWLLKSELVMLAIFALSIALVSSRRRLKQLVFLILIIGLIHSCVGIFAAHGGMLLVDVKQLDGHYDAARAWFINRNHFAAFVSLCMLGVLVFQLKALMNGGGALTRPVIIKQILSYKLVYHLALACGLVALVLSQSRAGFLALLMSMFFVLSWVGRDLVPTMLAFRKRTLLLPMTVLVMVIVAYFGSDLLARFSQDALLGERIEQWQVTWNAIKKAWLLGYGGNSYADVFQVFRGYQDFRQVLFNQAHNDYLHIWLEQGLIGLCLWLALVTLVLRAAYAHISMSKSTLVTATLLATLIVLLAALSQSFVDFNLQILNIRYYFFVIMSLAFSVPTIRQKTRSSSNSAQV